MNLQTAYARWLLALEPPEWIPTLACKLLENGIETPSVVEVAGLHKPTNRDAAEIIERMFSELGLKPLSKREAAVMYARQIAFEVVREAIAPYVGASLLCEIWRISPDIESSLSDFVYLADIYHDPGESQDQLDELIRQSASGFLSDATAWSA